MRELLTRKNVVAVYSGTKKIAGFDTGRKAVVVRVTKKVPLFSLKKQDRIPPRWQGKETDVVETDEIRALERRTGKWRPAPGGVSIGHPEITAGTLGAIVKKDGVPFILSNNHVLANCNDASRGDLTFQPGKADGGKIQDSIAHLTSFVPIRFEGEESTCPLANFVANLFNFFATILGRKSRLGATVSMSNTVDCAIARPIMDEDVSREILDIGIPSDYGSVKEGDFLRKSGRTSGVTTGKVLALDGIIKVSFGHKSAIFVDQIVTDVKMADPGDSGSVVLNAKNEIVGLLFAGSSTLTIINKIDNVRNSLGLD